MEDCREREEHCHLMQLKATTEERLISNIQLAY